MHPHLDFALLLLSTLALLCHGQWGRMGGKGKGGKGGRFGGQGGTFGGQSGGFGGQNGGFGGQNGGFGGQSGGFGGQSGGFGGQTGGFGGLSGGSGGPNSGFGGQSGGDKGKNSKEPSYYIEKYAIKEGDVLIAKDGNGKTCSDDDQTRSKSAAGLEKMVTSALKAAQAGNCEQPTEGPGGGKGKGKGKGQGPPPQGGFGSFSGFGNSQGQNSWARRFKRQSFGNCGTSTSTYTCDSGDTRVESLYSEEIHGDYRLIVANGIPEHCYQTQQIEPNPNVACEHFRYIYAPKKVVVDPKTIQYKDTPMGPVGIAVSGAFLYNHKSGESCNVAGIQEKESFDSCDGHADPECRYHYHKAPICITKWDNCGLMGYMMDGIPVYGECTINAQTGPVRLKSCYHLKSGSLGCDADKDYDWRDETSSGGCHLDAANGKYFTETTTTNNPAVTFEKGDYAYFVTPEYPFLMPKYVGEKLICKFSPFDA